MRKLVACLLFAGVCLWSSGSFAENFREEVVASTLVTGTVQITAEGKVHSYKIDQADKLSAAVRDLLDRNIPTWTFRLAVALPVDITERMTIRIVAKAVDDKHDAISIVSASFDDDFHTEDETVVPVRRTQPRYPGMSIAANVNGVVYTLALVGRDGRPQKVLAEQVNLRTAVPKRYQEQFRKDLANAAIRAISSWKWTIPTSGRLADLPGWWVRVPVVFTLNDNGKLEVKEAGYGEWEAYIPGPRLQMSLDESGRNLQSQGSDAIADGNIQLDDSSVKLTTPLGGG